MKQLVIIDGNAILHRAYHAIPHLNSQNGQPANAVYGFASILLRLISSFKPDSLIICFDTPEPTFRKKIFKEYQAERPEMEDNLVGQIDIVKKMVKDLGVCQMEKAGFEADDVIGTLTHQVKEYKVIIVTGDRDLLQLVDEHTQVHLLVKGLTQSALLDINGVREKMGVIPKQLPDLKALMGDASDNYPGVKGIGPKTAVELVNKFSTLEGIYRMAKSAHSGISERTQKLLLTNEENAYLSRKLATIVLDTPVKFKEQEANFRGDDEKMRLVFLELGFGSLAKRVGNNREQIAANIKQSEKIKENDQLGLF